MPVNPNRRGAGPAFRSRARIAGRRGVYSPAAGDIPVLRTSRESSGTNIPPNVLQLLVTIVALSVIRPDERSVSGRLSEGLTLPAAYSGCNYKFNL